MLVRVGLLLSIAEKSLNARKLKLEFLNYITIILEILIDIKNKKLSLK